MNDKLVCIGIMTLVGFMVFCYCMTFGIPAFSRLTRLKRKARKLHAEIMHLESRVAYDHRNILLSYLDSQRKERMDALGAEFRKTWRSIRELDPKCPPLPGD